MTFSKEKKYLIGDRKGQYELTTADQKHHCFFMDDTDIYEYFPINSKIEEYKND
jgi:hypothetical protein